MTDEFLTELTPDGVLISTFNRPEQMNALNVAIGAGLHAAIDRANHDPDVRAILLTGNGRAFCAGAEVTSGSDPTRGKGAAPPLYDYTDPLKQSGRMAIAFAECRVPLVAAVNGFAVGAGFGILTCCDVRIMGESARVGPIFIKRGLASDYGAAYWLPRIVGIARAYEIFYNGNPIDAAAALEAGLANRIVPDDELFDEALKVATSYAAGPPIGNARIRQLLARSTDTSMRDFLELEWAYQLELLNTADAAEGFRAFVEQRAPNFTGS
jgi:2-(1,2-epoxy-1,2-dihydrophenyl)acetyl-CoA isomerase